LEFFRIVSEVFLFFIKAIYLFLKKEVSEEFKRPTNAFGIFLYLICATFIISLVTKNNVTPNIWGAFFWILMMFVSFSVLNKNLNAEEQKKWNYYYLLVHPIQFILARIFFHSLFLWILGFANFILLSLWIKNPILSYEAFTLAILLGGLGLASSLTLISSISVQSNHPTLLMSVLGFPLIIPLIWTLIKVTLLSIQGIGLSESSHYVFFLASLNIINILLSIILFPMVWKE
jgi:heme exporter protein B